MHAALITGRERLEVREFPEPRARPGAAVIQIERCGICGTDVAAYRSGDPYPPFLCGHEWVGRVAATGPGVTSVHEGDRAVMGVPAAYPLAGLGEAFVSLALGREAKILVAPGT